MRRLQVPGSAAIQLPAASCTARPQDTLLAFWLRNAPVIRQGLVLRRCECVHAPFITPRAGGYGAAAAGCGLRRGDPIAVRPSDGPFITPRAGAAALRLRLRAAARITNHGRVGREDAPFNSLRAGRAAALRLRAAACGYLTRVRLSKPNVTEKKGVKTAEEEYGLRRRRLQYGSAWCKPSVSQGVY